MNLSDVYFNVTVLTKNLLVFNMKKTLIKFQCSLRFEYNTAIKNYVYEKFFCHEPEFI